MAKTRMPQRSRSGGVNTVYIQFDYGTPELGWCDQCLLPSLVTVPVVILLPNGVMPMGSMTKCAEHDLP